MNTTVNTALVRSAAALGLLVFSSIGACTSAPDDGGNAPGPSTAGNSTAIPSAGAGGGSSAGASNGGSSGQPAGAACTMTSECPMGQLCNMNTCQCPKYAPDYCMAAGKCANFTKDPDHCGNCDTACGATQACAASACVPEPMPLGAEIAGCGSLKLLTAVGKLYVLATMTGELSSVDPATGALTSVASGVTGATAFAVDATNAYIAAGMSIVRVPLAGGEKATAVTETATIYDVAVDGGKLYYPSGKDVLMADAAGTAAKGTSVAVGVDEGIPQGVAVSGGFVLYASAEAFNLELDPIEGEGHVKIGASQGSLIFGHRSVQVDATNVYWVNGGVQMAPIMGAEHPQTAACTALGNVTAYAVNATSVYFASDTGDVEKAMIGAPESTWVARGLKGVGSIALDDTSMYIAHECKILKTAL